MTAARNQLHPTILKTRNAIGRETGARVRLPDAPPYSSYSNPILYEKGFGYFFVYGRFAFATATNTPVGCLSNRTVCVSRWRGFAPTSSATRVRRAVNEQRQGITMAVVSCLLLLMPKHQRNILAMVPAAYSRLPKISQPPMFSPPTFVIFPSGSVPPDGYIVSCFIQ